MKLLPFLLLIPILVVSGTAFAQSTTITVNIIPALPDVGSDPSEPGDGGIASDPEDLEPNPSTQRRPGGGGGGSRGGGGGGGGFSFAPVLAIYDQCSDVGKVILVAVTYGNDLYASLSAQSKTYEGVRSSLPASQYVSLSIPANVFVFEFTTDKLSEFTVRVFDSSKRQMGFPVDTQLCTGYQKLFPVTGAKIIDPTPPYFAEPVPKMENADLVSEMEKSLPPPVKDPFVAAITNITHGGTTYSVYHNDNLKLKQVIVDEENITADIFLQEEYVGEVALFVGNLVAGDLDVIIEDNSIPYKRSDSYLVFDVDNPSDKITIKGSVLVVPEFGHVVGFIFIISMSFVIIWIRKSSLYYLHSQ